MTTGAPHRRAAAEYERLEAELLKWNRLMLERALTDPEAGAYFKCKQEFEAFRKRRFHNR